MTQRLRTPSLRAMGEWSCLVAVSLAFLHCGATRSTSTSSGFGVAAPTDPFTVEAYWMQYESHQQFGCGPECLNRAQLRTVQRRCLCNRALDKYAQGGLDGLTLNECLLIAKVLPTQHRPFDDFPAYVSIVHACEARLKREGLTHVDRR